MKFRKYYIFKKTSLFQFGEKTTQILYEYDLVGDEGWIDKVYTVDTVVMCLEQS